MTRESLKVYNEDVSTNHTLDLRKSDAVNADVSRRRQRTVKLTEKQFQYRLEQRRTGTAE